MMKGLFKRILFLGLVLTLLAASSAFAFEDVGSDSRAKKVEALKREGIINGVNKNRFMPQQTIDWAQGVQLTVKAFGLKKDADSKKSKASDYFKGVGNGQWYSEAFVIAAQNGLAVPKSVQPNRKMTREEFAHLLMSAVDKTGDYAFIEIYILIKDEDKINPDYMNSIQRLLVSKIVSLDKNGKFNPQKPITRIEAAEWIYNALEFVKKQHDIDIPEPDDVTLQVEKVTDEVNKITLSRGQKPNAGYTIAITRIEFKDDKTAVIYYRTNDPEPGKMYAQVITEPKAVTFLSRDYTPILQNDASTSVSSPRLNP